MEDFTLVYKVAHGFSKPDRAAWDDYVSAGAEAQWRFERRFAQDGTIPPEKFKPFLMGVIKRACIDQYRHDFGRLPRSTGTLARGTRSLDEMLESDLTDWEPSHEDDFDGAMLLAWAKDMVRRRCRRGAWEALMRGECDREMAARWGMSRSRVRQIRLEARAVLRKEWAA